MRFYQLSIGLIMALTLFSCAGNSRPASPRETIRDYTQAIKKKDVAAMRDLLSKDSLKMAADEAREQNVSPDEIIQKENLFSEDQKVVEFRNEEITGDKATLEMKDSNGIWNAVHFVKEDGIWKIDKKSYADELIKQVDEDNKRLDEQINKDRER